MKRPGRPNSSAMRCTTASVSISWPPGWRRRTVRSSGRGPRPRSETCTGSSTRDASRSSISSNPPGGGRHGPPGARRDTATGRALERERDRLASRLDEQEQAHNEAEQSLPHEVEQLRRASEQARQDASTAASRASRSAVRSRPLRTTSVASGWSTSRRDGFTRIDSPL